MNDLQLLEMVAETDAYAPQTPLPASTWSREDALHEIKRRTGMDTRDTTKKATPPGVTQQIEPSTKPGAFKRLTKQTGKRRWSGALVGAVAFAVVVIVVGAVILLASLGGDELAPATPVTTQAPPITTPTFSVDEALTVKDAYIATSNAGDTDAVLALFEPDSRVVVGTLTRDLVTFERYLVWSISQGTTVTASDCTASGLEDAVRLSCDSSRHQHLAVAVGAPAPQGILTLTVSADGIRSFSEANNPSDFAVVNVPFDRWLDENHPEDFAARIPFGTWDSVAAAEQAGTLRGQYADEWAAYLDANGCTYNDTDCPSFTVDEALAVSEEYFATHNAGDVDSVFALFTADATFQDNWSGLLDRTGWEPRTAWDMAQGETLASPECTVGNEVPGAVTVRCAHGTLDAVVLAVGSAPIPTNTTLTITPDGISEIRELYSSLDFTFTGFPFTRWMEANHPEDAEAAGCCEADTVEESVARGELRARYAQEWAVYLEANDCTYTDNC